MKINYMTYPKLQASAARALELQTGTWPFILTMGLALLIGAGCESRPPHQSRVSRTDPGIAQVLAQKAGAGWSCARVLIDEGRIASVHLHGVQYLETLEHIDTAACPEPFRAAWADYLAAWKRKLNREQADEKTLDLISLWKGEVDELPGSLKRIEAYDTEAAWQNCERVASEYGVEPARVTPITVERSAFR